MASPCIVLSTSIRCAFSLCRKTYNISPPMFKYRIGVECEDIFVGVITRQLSVVHTLDGYTYVVLGEEVDASP